MKINRVKNNPALRRKHANVGDVLARKVAPAEHYGIELRAVRHEVVADFFDIRIINNFDSAFLQLARVGTNVCQIIGNEHDAMPKLVEELDDLEHSERS